QGGVVPLVVVALEAAVARGLAAIVVEMVQCPGRDLRQTLGELFPVAAAPEVRVEARQDSLARGCPVRGSCAARAVRSRRRTGGNPEAGALARGKNLPCRKNCRPVLASRGPGEVEPGLGERGVLPAAPRALAPERSWRRPAGHPRARRSPKPA